MQKTVGSRMSIILKSPKEIQLLREANLVVFEVLSTLREMVKPGITTGELDAKASELTTKFGAKAAFLNYPGSSPEVPPFSGCICASVNDEIVHGVPGQRVLKEGDIISIDYGAIKNGFVGDSAITVPVGKVSDEAEKLMQVTKSALYAGISACKVGARIGDISSAVQRVVEDAGFAVIRDFVGHGVGRSMHEEPQVPNYGKANRGRRLQRGMVIAIEPMVAVGDYGVKLKDDLWTAATADGSLSAHFEHSVAITDNGPYILSEP